MSGTTTVEPPLVRTDLDDVAASELTVSWAVTITVLVAAVAATLLGVVAVEVLLAHR